MGVSFMKLSAAQHSAPLVTLAIVQSGNSYKTLHNRYSTQQVLPYDILSMKYQTDKSVGYNGISLTHSAFIVCAQLVLLFLCQTIIRL